MFFFSMIDWNSFSHLPLYITYVLVQAGNLKRTFFRVPSHLPQNVRGLASFYDKTVATWSTMDLPPVKIQNLFAPTSEGKQVQSHIVM